MSLAGHVTADLAQMHLHGLGFGPRQQERRPFAVFRADGTEQVGTLIALIGGLTRARTLLRPQACLAVLLPDTRFVLEPDFNRRLLRQIGYVRCKRVGEVFLNALMILSSCLGCCGRALMWAKPSSPRRSEIARSL